MARKMAPRNQKNNRDRSVRVRRPSRSDGADDKPGLCPGIMPFILGLGALGAEGFYTALHGLEQDIPDAAHGADAGRLAGVVPQLLPQVRNVHVQ